MRSWSFTGTNEPLVLTDIPQPVPGPGEVVLEIRAAGICHTDVSIMTDPSRLETMPVRPIVLGHEIAGVVRAIGPGVTGVKPGDRCGVWPVGVTGSRDRPGMEASRPASGTGRGFGCRCPMGSRSSSQRLVPMLA